MYKLTKEGVGWKYISLNNHYTGCSVWIISYHYILNLSYKTSPAPLTSLGGDFFYYSIGISGDVTADLVGSEQWLARWAGKHIPLRPHWQPTHGDGRSDLPGDLTPGCHKKTHQIFRDHCHNLERLFKHFDPKKHRHEILEHFKLLLE